MMTALFIIVLLSFLVLLFKYGIMLLTILAACVYRIGISFLHFIKAGDKNAYLHSIYSENKMELQNIYAESSPEDKLGWQALPYTIGFLLLVLLLVFLI